MVCHVLTAIRKTGWWSLTRANETLHNMPYSVSFNGDTSMRLLVDYRNSTYTTVLLKAAYQQH